MTIDQIPALFLPLFFATFVVNAAYVLCMFLLRRERGGPVTFGVGDTLSLLRFVFGRRDDASPAALRLAGLIKVLFPLGLVMTLGLLVWAVATVLGAA